MSSRCSIHLCPVQLWLSYFRLVDSCNTYRYREINVFENIKEEGFRILREKNIKVIRNNDISVGSTVNAFREEGRLMVSQQSSRNYEAICLYVVIVQLVGETF
ncbi:MAG: hypothetical protein ACFFD2_02315 [Promethearchaeota archaeon]